MKFLLALVGTLLFGSTTFAQTITPGSKLYIEPMNGFESYLAAAILAKKIPVSVVLDKARADYLVTGTFKEEAGGTTGNGSLVRPLHNRTNYSTSVSIVDPRTTAVAFAYSSQRSASHEASKELAEDWATHLRDEMLKKK
jgi:hypothetical protein